MFVTISLPDIRKLWCTIDCRTISLFSFSSPYIVLLPVSLKWQRRPGPLAVLSAIWAQTWQTSSGSVFCLVHRLLFPATLPLAPVFDRVIELNELKKPSANKNHQRTKPRSRRHPPPAARTNHFFKLARVARRVKVRLFRAQDNRFWSFDIQDGGRNASESGTTFERNRQVRKSGTVSINL